jgi:hypothetical protein
MKRSLVVILAIGAFLTARAFAALGQNEIEVENLFGVPVRQGAPDKKGITTNVYQKGNYVILVQFLNHLSLAESYARSDKKELSQKEIDAFLEGSSNGRPWLKDPSKQQAWERADRKANAWCQKTSSGLPTLLIEAK